MYESSVLYPRLTSSKMTTKNTKVPRASPAKTDKLTPLTSPLWLPCLGGAGFILLWGVSAANGTVYALFLAQERGILPDGRPLRTRYTGSELVDRNLIFLVAFFDVLTNDRASPASYWLLLDLCALLAAINTWVVIESRRRGVRNVLLRQ